MGIGLVDPILPVALDAAPRDARAGRAALHQLPGRHRRRDARHRLGVEPHRRQAHADRRSRPDHRFQRARRAPPASINGIVGFRAGWGLGNALFIATSLAVDRRVRERRRRRRDRPLRDRARDRHRARPAARRRARRHQLARPVLRRHGADGNRPRRDHRAVQDLPRPERKVSIVDPLRRCATAACSPWASTALSTTGASSPCSGTRRSRCISARTSSGTSSRAGACSSALFAIFGAPWIRRRLGIARALYLNLALFAIDVLVIGSSSTRARSTIVAVIVVRHLHRHEQHDHDAGGDDRLARRAPGRVRVVRLHPLHRRRHRAVGGGQDRGRARRPSAVLHRRRCDRRRDRRARERALAARRCRVRPGRAHADEPAIPEPFDAEAELLLEQVER